jgi:hypothetical protein
VDLETLIGLETQVWDALCRGDAEADARLLSDDFLGVYPTGYASRGDHVAALANGATVAAYELHDARLVAVTERDALLCYRADYRVPGSDAAASMWVSSLWSQRDGEWRNTFSQDTAVAARNDLP